MGRVIPCQDSPRGHLWTESGRILGYLDRWLPSPARSPLRRPQVLSNGRPPRLSPLDKEQLSRLVSGNFGLVDGMSPVAAPCASAGSVWRNGNDWPRHRLGTSPQPYCLFGVNYFFPYFHFYALFGMLSKGIGERFLLSKDEPLTPNIDGVVALWIFR